MKPLYTADVKVIGGREGSVESTDGVLNHKLSMPKELGGPGGDGTNPEQLFAAGYGACYESALANIARKEGVELKDVVIHSQVMIGKDDGADGFKLAVKLKIEMPESNEARRRTSRRRRMRSALIPRLPEATLTWS